MNARQLEALLTSLYKKYPNLGTVNVEKGWWFDRGVHHKNHRNSRVRVTVFDSAGRLLDGINLPFDATILDVKTAIIDVIEKFFPTGN